MDGDTYLEEQVIELRYQNQVLQEEKRKLKDKLEKAYEFMKQFVIGGMNLLEKFKDWIGEKVRDVVRGKQKNAKECFKTLTNHYKLGKI